MINGRCFKCGGEGTHRFVHSALDMVHGGGTPICKRCLLTIQIEHAKERAAALPELERGLAELEDDA